MSPAQGPVDPGLQAERTHLAWTRTMLALVVVAAFSLRVSDRLGLLALLICGIALLGATLRSLHAGRRYQSANDALEAEAGRPWTVGVIVTATSVCATGVLALAAVALRP